MKKKISFTSGAIVFLLVIGVYLAPIILNAQEEVLEEKTVAEKSLEQHKVRQVTINMIENKVFGKVPVKSYHQKVHQNGTNCQLCHGVMDPVTAPDTRNCANCHGTPEDVAKRSAKLEPNPHDSPHWETELPCDACHKEHSKSVSYCQNCHQFDHKVP